MKPGWTSFLLTLAEVALGVWIGEDWPSIGGMIVGAAVALEVSRRLRAWRGEA